MSISVNVHPSAFEARHRDGVTWINVLTEDSATRASIFLTSTAQADELAAAVVAAHRQLLTASEGEH